MERWPPIFGGPTPPSGASKRIAAQLRHEPRQQAAKELDEALELGGRLFWDLSSPLPISERSPKGKVTEPPCSRHAIHPGHPARLRLQSSNRPSPAAWLIDRWTDLMRRYSTATNSGSLPTPSEWSNSSANTAIDMADDLDVLSVFLCTLMLLKAPRPGRSARHSTGTGADRHAGELETRNQRALRPKSPSNASRSHAGWPNCRWPGWPRATKNKQASGSTR